MGAEVTEASFKSKLSQIGRAALSTLYPNDVEFYLLALELIDGSGNTVDYFAWPILPEEIRENHVEITNIRKTMGGVNVLKNTTFVPHTISIKGTFGRKFKLLFGNPIQLAGFGMSIKSGKFKVTPPHLLQNPIPEFSSFAKSGYGCVKLLEAMKNKSNQLDENGKPYSLYLYNPILGDNYQVEFNNFTHMQDSGKNNMIPAYSMQLTATAPLDSLLSRLSNIKSALKNLTISVLQKKANGVASNLRLIPGLGS